jgi:hypothetical protein
MNAMYPIVAHPQIPASVLKFQVLLDEILKNGADDKLRCIWGRMKGFFYSSILFNNSFRASNSSLERVRPLPIFPPSGDHSRRSYFGSRSFQLTRLSCLLQPEGASDRMPILLMISNLMSGMVWGSLIEFINFKPDRFQHDPGQTHSSGSNSTRLIRLLWNPVRSISCTKHISLSPQNEDPKENACGFF